MKWKVIAPTAALLATAAGAAVLHLAPTHAAADSTVGRTATLRNASALEIKPPVVTGEATKKNRGDLALYIPAELAVRDGAFDLLVHFHGVAKNQEANIEEARLPAAVVTVNLGAQSDPYARAFAAPGAFDRVVDFAEKEVRAARPPATRAGRIALSGWSAGGAAVRSVIKDPSYEDRVDAVIIADGLFSSWADEGKKTVRREPLDPFIAFARKATADDKLFVVTHTAIATEYPNVEECTGVLLSELDLPRGPALPATQHAGGTPTYSVDRGSFHVRGVDGKGPEDHVAQIRALDDAYSELRRRWHR
jgi:hypothetical protein